MRPIKIDVQVYQHTVYLVGSPDAFYRKVKALNMGEPEPQECAGLCYTVGLNTVIGVYDKEIDTLVHELTHAALFILKGAGMNVQDSNGEGMAYLMEFLFKRATAALRK